MTVYFSFLKLFKSCQFTLTLRKVLHHIKTKILFNMIINFPTLVQRSAVQTFNKEGHTKLCSPGNHISEKRKYFLQIKWCCVPFTIFYIVKTRTNFPRIMQRLIFMNQNARRKNADTEQNADSKVRVHVNLSMKLNHMKKVMLSYNEKDEATYT